MCKVAEKRLIFKNEIKNSRKVYCHQQTLPVPGFIVEIINLLLCEGEGEGYMRVSWIPCTIPNSLAQVEP